MHPEMLGILLPVLAAGVCLLLMVRVVTAVLKLVFLVLAVWLLLQFAAVKFPHGLRHLWPSPPPKSLKTVFDHAHRSSAENRLASQ